MDSNLSDTRWFIAVALFFLSILACGSGYWMARFLPVRFNGEKVLLGLLMGTFVALATYGLNKLTQVQVQVSHLITPIGWFLLQGVAGEITVQVASRRRRTKP